MSAYKLSVQTYQLTIAVYKPVKVQVGKLGFFNICSGHYIYTGSARRNIIDRVSRHLKKSKKLRWHIDYLLVHLYEKKVGEIADIRFSKKSECGLNQNTDGEIIVPGFGSSDCVNRCCSHLKFLAK